MRVCSVDGCDAKHYGLGCCRDHWRVKRRELGMDVKPHDARRLVSCIVCGAEVMRYLSKNRMPTCSNQCRRDLTFGVSEPLPEFHMARWVGQFCPWSPPKPRTARFVACVCAECGERFIGDHEALWSQQAESYCSRRCMTRRARRRRRAREHGRENHWRWTDFVAIWLRFERCCAYCEQPIEGQPDPDHVVPLSRGGKDVVGNLLPACRACNSDKADLTLEEWRVERERRGLDPRRYSWSEGDERFHHLVPQRPTGAAWRHRAA